MEKKIESLEKFQKDLDLQLTDPKRFKELSQKEGFFNQYEKKSTKKATIRIRMGSSCRAIRTSMNRAFSRMLC